jgi:uncharacterized lipoprotein YddW (UPF0748 family)
MHGPHRSHCRRSQIRAVALAACFVVGLLSGTLGAGSEKPATDEVRALWVRSGSLSTPAAVAAMVATAKQGRFNTLLVQVRARGDAYFNGGLEPRATVLATQPDSFDPLALTLRLAHAQGLRVHAWIDIGVVSSATWLPESRAHVVYRHPEWLMVPRALARDMALLDANGQLYLDKLLRWTRAQGADVEGLYLSPVPEEAAAATVAIVADIVARYPVDGVHLDYARYPNADFDYSLGALEAFRADILRRLAASALAPKNLPDEQDLVGWTETFADEWCAFRRDRLTSLVARIRESVKARRPDVIVSAAVPPDPVDAATRRLQDWAVWLDEGLLDVVCPMAYTGDRAAFAAQVDHVREIAGPRPVWAGIGAYRLSASDTVENIRIARRLGAAGIILFSYDALVNLPRHLDYLAQVSRAAFTR